MEKIISIKRFIDDGTGIHFMSNQEFDVWRTNLKNEVNKSGLNIKDTDWNIAESSSDTVNFLDLLIWIDDNNTIQTDLYIKPTDSRNYLSFESCHPNHMFAGIVYTQALRIRRIVSINDRLKVQLDLLAEAFLKCRYPKKLINDIIEKVKNLPRILRRPIDSTPTIREEKIIMVSKYGADKHLHNIVDSLPNKNHFPITKVHKTSPSLKKMICTPRRTCLGPRKGISNKCLRPRCSCCDMMSQNDNVCDTSRKKHQTGNGNCTTKLVLYHLKCEHCGISYVGKTAQMLANRISGHRAKYYDLIRNMGNIEKTDDKDEYTLGKHLYNNHGLRNPDGFNSSYKLTILEKCTPLSLDVKEHLWIQKLRTITPMGLNSVDPFGIPLLH